MKQETAGQWLGKVLGETTPVRRGDLEWPAGDYGGAVVFVEREDGRFLIVQPPSESDSYAGGVDPYGPWVVQDRVLDKGAIVIVNIRNGEPVCAYSSRPKHIEIFYEDCLKAAVYFNCKMLIENNIPGCIQYFLHRGGADRLGILTGGKSYGRTSYSPSDKSDLDLTFEFARMLGAQIMNNG